MDLQALVDHWMHIHIANYTPCLFLWLTRWGNGTPALGVKLNFMSGTPMDDVDVSASSTVLYVHAKIGFHVLESSQETWDRLYKDEADGVPKDIQRMINSEEDAIKKLQPHEDEVKEYDWEFTLPFEVKNVRRPKYLMTVDYKSRSDVMYFALESAEESLYEKKQPAKKLTMN